MKIFILLLLVCSHAFSQLEKPFAKCPDKPNCVNSYAEGEQFIEPLRIKGNQAHAIQKLLKYLKKLERVKLIQAKDNYIHVVFTSKIFRFDDDVEFRQVGETMHIRSASRVGYSDMGANRKRIEKIRSELKL